MFTMFKFSTFSRKDFYHDFCPEKQKLTALTGNFIILKLIQRHERNVEFLNKYVIIES